MSISARQHFDFFLFIADSSVHNEVDRSDFKAKRSLTASSETIVIDRNKCTSTPFNSKIPVLHPRSDPLYYEEPRREQGLKLVNDGSLKKICSNSKIPVSTKRPSSRRVLRQPFTPYAQNYHRRHPELDKVPPRRNDSGAASGRYTHVKSKLAAYIHRPTKMDALKSSQSKSPNDSRIKHDNAYPNFCGIKRISSRTSLDTYTCEYKAVMQFFLFFSHFSRVLQSSFEPLEYFPTSFTHSTQSYMLFRTIYTRGFSPKLTRYTPLKKRIISDWLKIFLITIWT